MNIDELLQQEIAAQSYPLLFVTVSAAHLYGFPSPDSDYDLRGMHILPAREVVGLYEPCETVEVSKVREGHEIDLVTHDAAKFFRLLLKQNGYVLEYFVLGNHDFYGGRIAEVRQMVAKLADAHARLYYLPVASVMSLTDTVALIGCDGWGDAQLGNGFYSRVELQDHYLIHDLAVLPTMGRFARVRALGEEEAERVRLLLPAALNDYQHVILATHEPPFREACWHRGRISDDDWLPHFTCKAVGDVLLKIMRERPT
jgi:hypothetical protein